jgi:hypothetical protein
MRFRTALRRGRLRARVTYSNVVATLALFIALADGSAYAATKLITGSQIASGTITAKNIKQRSLQADDFARHQLRPERPVPRVQREQPGTKARRATPGLRGFRGILA